MSGFFSSLRHRLLLFLAVLGPGVIAAIADNDAAGVATYSIVGAEFGYSMLFILLLTTVLLAVTQEIGARLGIVTGKGLADLIRENYGVRTACFIFGILSIANMGSIVSNFAGLMAATSIFALPKVPFLLLFVILMILFVYKGNYQINQRIFLGSTLFYIAYIFAAFFAKPHWSEAFVQLVSPFSIQWSWKYMFAAIALVGTTITPWGQFFIQSFVVDKKLTPDKLKYEQTEVYFGAFLTNFFSFFMIVAIAATLFANKIPINGPQEAALAITPFAGQFASLLFSFGLLNAGFMGATIISLSTAYAYSEFFGYEGSLDSKFARGKSFYIIFFTQIVIASLIVLIPRISLFKIVLYTQSLNGILLPVIMYFLLHLANNKSLMGQHTNTPVYNYICVISLFVISVASVVVLIGGLFGFL